MLAPLTSMAIIRSIVRDSSLTINPVPQPMSKTLVRSTSAVIARIIGNSTWRALTSRFDEIWSTRVFAMASHSRAIWLCRTLRTGRNSDSRALMIPQVRCSCEYFDQVVGHGKSWVLAAGKLLDEMHVLERSANRHARSVAALHDYGEARHGYVIECREGNNLRPCSLQLLPKIVHLLKTNRQFIVAGFLEEKRPDRLSPTPRKVPGKDGHSPALRDPLVHVGCDRGVINLVLAGTALPPMHELRNDQENKQHDRNSGQQLLRLRDRAGIG